MPQAQYMQALNVANGNRRKRAALKATLRELNHATALKRAGACIMDPPTWLRGMRLAELLRACPRVGRIKALKMLRRWDISESLAVGSLTERQRELIALELGAKELR